MNVASDEFIFGLPKAELHLHIEGTLSLDMKRKFAKRNGLNLGEASFSPLRTPGGSSSKSLDIQQYKMFLGLYSEGLKVLHTVDDFYELTYAYYERCKANNIIYTEISFDPQAHTDRGIAFETVVEGIQAARVDASSKLGIHSQLIMCINRDLPLDSAIRMIESARPHRHIIAGVGLDSVEDGHPPIKFKRAYDLARSEEYRLTAHCDVDMTFAAEHVRQCIEDLGVLRIDHGINVLDEPTLVTAALERAVCFTACPTWRDGDPAPRRVDRIRKMADLGLHVTLNTDDPGYFASGYMNTMLPEVAKCGTLGEADLTQFMRNAFNGAWVTKEERSGFLRQLDDYVRTTSLPMRQ